MESIQSAHENVIVGVLERHTVELNEISQQLWEKPELSGEEEFAHTLLAGFLERQSFTVTRQYKDLRTAFRADFQSANFHPDLHPTVAVLCEYDALPEIGHACGHNLIAEAGLATGLALQEVLRNKSTNSENTVEGRVVLLGTPAEEAGGGKVILIEEGAFKDIDFAMMVHPWGHNDLEPVILGNDRCQVEFFGKAAHASCGPWEGVNALDAAVAVYENVAMLRQQMKPNWRIHGVITNGGAKPNIIPDYTVSQYMVRAPTQTDLDFLKGRVMEIFHAAAKATGCSLKMAWTAHPYAGMMHSSTMSRLYKNFSTADGVVFPESAVPSFNGSTDMGNVSLEVPSIHPGFSLGASCMIHTRDFQRLAGSAAAQKYTLLAAKSMALTCVTLFTRKDVREQVKLEFEERKKLFGGR